MNLLFFKYVLLCFADTKLIKELKIKNYIFKALVGLCCALAVILLIATRFFTVPVFNTAAITFLVLFIVAVFATCIYSYAYLNLVAREIAGVSKQKSEYEELTKYHNQFAKYVRKQSKFNLIFVRAFLISVVALFVIFLLGFIAKVGEGLSDISILALIILAICIIGFTLFYLIQINFYAKEFEFYCNKTISDLRALNLVAGAPLDYDLNNEIDSGIERDRPELLDSMMTEVGGASVVQPQVAKEKPRKGKKEVVETISDAEKLEREYREEYFRKKAEEEKMKNLTKETEAKPETKPEAREEIKPEIIENKPLTLKEIVDKQNKEIENYDKQTKKSEDGLASLKREEKEHAEAQKSELEERMKKIKEEAEKKASDESVKSTVTAKPKTDSMFDDFNFDFGAPLDTKAETKPAEPSYDLDNLDFDTPKVLGGENEGMVDEYEILKNDRLDAFDSSKENNILKMLREMNSDVTEDEKFGTEKLTEDKLMEEIDLDFEIPKFDTIVTAAKEEPKIEEPKVQEKPVEEVKKPAEIKPALEKKPVPAKEEEKKDESNDNNDDEASNITEEEIEAILKALEDTTENNDSDKDNNDDKNDNSGTAVARDDFDLDNLDLDEFNKKISELKEKIKEDDDNN